MKNGSRIPRIVHYCWFGGGEKSKKMKQCMRSWQTFLPDYEWMEWNEATFDVQVNDYVRQAYAAKKYAFVSDYARLFALYQHGGIYLDTDVEVIQPLDRFLAHEAFSGFEDERFLQSGTMGAVQAHPWIGALMADYAGRSFVNEEGSFDLTTNTAMMSRYAEQKGLELNGRYQVKDGVVFYPRTYFSPYDYVNGASYLTKESYTIHHFAKSWMPAHVRYRSQVKRMAGRYIGPKFVAAMRTIFKSGL